MLTKTFTLFSHKPFTRSGGAVRRGYTYVWLSPDHYHCTVPGLFPNIRSISRRLKPSHHCQLNQYYSHSKWLHNALMGMGDLRSHSGLQKLFELCSLCSFTKSTRGISQELVLAKLPEKITNCFEKMNELEGMWQDRVVESSPGVVWDWAVSYFSYNLYCCFNALVTLWSVSAKMCQCQGPPPGAVSLPGLGHCNATSCQKRSRFHVTAGHHECYIQIWWASLDRDVISLTFTVPFFASGRLCVSVYYSHSSFFY